MNCNVASLVIFLFKEGVQLLYVEEVKGHSMYSSGTIDRSGQFIAMIYIDKSVILVLH